MSTRSVLPWSTLFAAIAALSLPPLARAADDHHGHHGHHGDEESPLHLAMEAMGDAMRVINRSLRADDPSAAKPDLLEAVQSMQAHALEAKLLEPPSVANGPAEARAARKAEFRSQLAGVIIIMLELERAILADDWEAARTRYGELRDARKAGHEKFNPEE